VARVPFFGALLAIDGGAAKPDEEVASIAADLNATAADLEHFQVLADRLGSFQSRLIAFPAMSGQNLCYSLLGATLAAGSSPAVPRRTGE
jgi:hypothetical protein